MQRFVIGRWRQIIIKHAQIISKQKAIHSWCIWNKCKQWRNLFTRLLWANTAVFTLLKKNQADVNEQARTTDQAAQVIEDAKHWAGWVLKLPLHLKRKTAP